MTEVLNKSFAQRLAERWGLLPYEGKSFQCRLPQGEFTITISPELGEDESRRFSEKFGGQRSVHVEGIFRSSGINYRVSFDDSDGDGIIGPSDRGGIFHSAQYFACWEDDGVAADFYTELAKIIEGYIA